jgi:hypothetical protein
MKPGWGFSLTSIVCVTGTAPLAVSWLRRLAAHAQIMHTVLYSSVKIKS